MTDGIEIPVTVEGAEEGASEIDLLVHELEGLGAAQDRASQASQAFTRQQAAQAEAARTAATQQAAASAAAIQFGQRLAGAANAVQALVGQLGGGSRAAGLIGAMANTSVQFAQLGAAAGPHGALVGGIVGAAIPALQALTAQHDAAAEAADRQRTALTHLATAVRQAQETRAREREAADVAAGVFGTDTSDSDLQRLAEEQRQHITAGRSTLARIDRGGGPSSRLEEIAISRVQSQIEDWTQALAGIEAEIARRSEQSVTGSSLGGVVRPGATPPTTRTRGGGRRDDGLGGVRSRIAGDLAYDLAEAHGQFADEADARAAAYEAELAAIDALTEKRRIDGDEQDQQAERFRQHMEERKQLEEQEAQRLDRINEQKKERFNDQVRGYESTTTAIVGGIVQAGEALASGAEDAGSAFKKLLAGFLEMIAQRAALSAGTEYAEAIASAARYDWSGFAQHTAAGVAFTGVAVAAGVGAGALNASAAAGAGAGQGAGPARPPGTGQTGGDRGGGTVNIYYNSPVVTAGTYDELGRSIRGMVLTSEGRHPAP